MDPFVEICFANKKYRSITAKAGGKFPKFNQSFEIEICSLNDDLSFTVMDENVISNDFVRLFLFNRQIGRIFLKASALCINNGVRDWVRTVNPEPL